MRDIEFMDKFIPAGKEGVEGIPAVRLEAGLTWMDVYAAASVDRNLVMSKVVVFKNDQKEIVEHFLVWLHSSLSKQKLTAQIIGKLQESVVGHWSRRALAVKGELCHPQFNLFKFECKLTKKCKTLFQFVIL